MAETMTSDARRSGRNNGAGLSPLGEMIRLVELRRRNLLSEAEYRLARQRLQTTS